MMHLIERIKTIVKAIKGRPAFCDCGSQIKLTGGAWTQDGYECLRCHREFSDQEFARRKNIVRHTVKTLPVALLLLLPINSEAQTSHYPWRSADFFSKCADLDDPRNVDHQRNPLTMNQYGMCARYIEGFEMAAQGNAGIPPDCLVNPLILFHSAKVLYEGNKGRNSFPGPYIHMAMYNDCRATH